MPGTSEILTRKVLASKLLSLSITVALAAFLAGCGGGSSSNNSSVSSTNQFTHVYVVFPAQSGVNNQHLMTTVMTQTAIEGVTVAVNWNDVETNSPGTSPCNPTATDTCQVDSAGFFHTYDWSTVDGNNAQWFSVPGSKKVNMILTGIGGASPLCAENNTCVNPITPYYVTSPGWAGQLATGVNDIINGNKDGCTNDVGLDTTSMTRDASGLVTVNEPNHGYVNGQIIWVGGSTPSNYNVTTQAGVQVQNATTDTFQYQSGTNTADSASAPGTVISAQQSYPVPYETPYKTAWQAFVAAAIYHFNNSSNLSQISYMRVGRSVGGEAYPYCVPNLEALPSPNTFSQTVWLNWYTDIDQFVASQGPKMQMLDPLNQAGTGQAGDPIDTSYADQEGQAAVTYKNMNGQTNGIGSQGLQASDITNYPGSDCSSDWCNLFNDNYQSGIPLELQQLGLSAPVSIQGLNNPTGSLVPLLPFAVSRHMTILELYDLDALLAYDPNYCVLPLVNGACGSGSVEIPTITLPPQDQPIYFQAVGQPGQNGQATGNGSYATTITQTQGQH